MRKLIFAAVLLLAAGSAEARWWIFGRGSSGTGLKYLYLNNIPAGEAGDSIKLFQETLPPGGEVKIKGRTAAEGTAGKVRLTLDDKGSWQDVKAAADGTFEYSFKPEAGKTYTLFIEITDAAGKTNEVDETKKVIELSAEHMQAKIRTALDALFDAYNRKNLQRFMAEAGGFAGDRAVLENAVKRDFDALNSIILRYSMNTAAADAQGRIFASITYNRMVFMKKTGASNTDSGSTELVLAPGGGKLSLYSMKQPLLFGLSDAGNLSAGLVPGGPGTALVLDEEGNLVSSAAYTSAGAAAMQPAAAPQE